MGRGVESGEPNQWIEKIVKAGLKSYSTRCRLSENHMAPAAIIAADRSHRKGEKTYLAKRRSACSSVSALDAVCSSREHLGRLSEVEIAKQSRKSRRMRPAFLQHSAIADWNGEALQLYQLQQRCDGSSLSPHLLRPEIASLLKGVIGNQALCALRFHESTELSQ